ncbi:MAG: NINE protein, partial [Saprospiraceae bacterium]
MKNKYVAAAMAFLLGTFGVHKFYLRNPGAGMFYIMMFVMTNEYFPVSAILGVIDGMRYLTMGQEEFDRKFNGSKSQLPPPLRRRNKRSKNREYYEYTGKKNKTSKRRGIEKVLRSNPFKKSGLKKYKEYDIEEAIVDFE